MVDFGVRVKKPQGRLNTYYSIQPGEKIMGAGYSDYISYYDGDTSGRLIYNMFPGSSGYGNGNVRSYNAFFTDPSEYWYFNEYFINLNTTPDNSIPRLFCPYLWPTQNPPQDEIRIPKESSVVAYKMGRPAPGIPIRVANYIRNGSNGQETWFEGPASVITDANGRAKFYAPSRDYQYLMRTQRGPGLVDKPILDDLMPVAFDEDGNREYDTSVTFFHGYEGRIVVNEQTRPTLQEIWANPYDARYNSMAFYWEDLTNIPGHKTYQFLIFEAGTRNLIQVFQTDNPYISVIMPINTDYTFCIIGYNTDLRQYCNSYIFTIGTGPAQWKATRSGLIASTSTNGKQIEAVRNSRETVQGMDLSGKNRLIRENSTRGPKLATVEEMIESGSIKLIDVPFDQFSSETGPAK